MSLRYRTIEFLRQRAASYTFGIPALLRRQTPTPQAEMMLADLARFCRAVGTPPWGATPEDTARYIGRLEVFRRITEHLHLSEARLLDLYSSYRPPQDDD